MTINKDFKIEVMQNNFEHSYEIKPQISIFPGGEINTKLILDGIWISSDCHVNITAHIKSSNHLMALLMITDALRRIGAEKIELIMPYIPYARQDRVNNLGESLSIKVFTDLINSQNYNTVEIWDSHSDVAVALLDRCHHVRQQDMVPYNVVFGKTLVSPDAGALKKIYTFATVFDIANIVKADKIRDTKTGEISGTAVHFNGNETDNTHFIIADDICDGGRTFIELAKEIKRTFPLAKVDLLVTHGIFSKGFDVFVGWINRIYVINPLIKIPSEYDFFVESLGNK